MALILNIETSATTCSVCLAENGTVIHEIHEIEPNQHTKIVTILIEQLFREAAKKYMDLDAVALSSGPGSYTGLRIGASVAKGLCFALDKPLIAVSTLQGMAWQMRNLVSLQKEAFFLRPVIAARKGAFYSALYDENLNCLEAQSYCNDVSSARFFHPLEKTFSAIFPAENQLKEFPHIFGKILDDVVLSANNLASLSFEKYGKGDFENRVLYEPDYITGFGKI